MRIVSGIRRGMHLFSLKGENTRPTSDKVKEAIFSMIQFDVKDAVCLDLFAGSGAMGIEAISRGAKYVYFVDHHQPAIDIIKKNLEKAKFSEFASVRASTAQTVVKTLKQHSIDIVFLDPPYGKNLVPQSIDLIMAQKVLKPDAVLVCEYHIEDEMPQVFGDWEVYKTKKYSDTVISLYKKT